LKKYLSTIDCLHWKEPVNSIEDLMPKLSKVAMIFKKDLNIPEEQINTTRLVISTGEIYVYTEKGWARLSVSSGTRRLLASGGTTS